MSLVFFFSAKILLFLENLVIKNYYLHWYEILGEACRMSILHPLKNFVSPPYKLFMKMNFSVRENWQKHLEKSKMYAHAKHTRTIWRRMLSIRLQLVSVCWACAYNLYTHAEHTLTICLLMLSMLAYAEHTLTTWTRMLSMRIQFEHVCWAYACQLHHIISRSNHIK